MAEVDSVLSPDIKLELNQKINVYDPPKDLTEYKNDSAKLSELSKKQKDTLRGYLKEVFFPGVDTYDAINPVSDTKATLKEAIEGRIGGDITTRVNNTKILRETHSSGHDPKPDGLYVSYDAGAKDVVSNPNFLITPGVILDPATKTKDGNIVNLVTAATDYKKLRNDTYIKQLGFVLDGNITITGDIEMTVEADGRYKIKIPTRFGELTSLFSNDTYKPSEDYFKGNETKNAFIKANINSSSNEDKNKIRFFLLAKELGDTLQVQWLNFVCAVSEDLPDGTKKYTKGNVVVSTNDTVVWLRSIVNSIPVIFTNKGITKYYRAIDADATTKALIIKSFIETIRKEVTTHNLSIIKTIENVISSGFTDRNTWVNDSATWYKSAGSTPRDKAIEFLRNVKVRLENVSKDIDLQISLQNEIDNAKRIAAKSHFLSPFTFCKTGGFYKTNNKVVALLEGGGIKFIAKQFVASKFPSAGEYDRLANFFMQGGRRRVQQGGVRKTKSQKIARTIQAKTETNVRTLLTQALEELNETTPITDYNFDEKDTRKAASDLVEGAALAFNKDNTLLWSIWQKNIRGAGEIEKQFFLYLFIRDYLPEIFTYAAMVKSSLAEILAKATVVNSALEGSNVEGRVVTRGMIGTAGSLKDKCAANVALFPKVSLDLKRIDDRVDYYVEDHEFLIVPDIRTKDQILRSAALALGATYQAITLAAYFYKDFPLLCRGSAASFLNYFNTNYAEKKIAITELAPEENKFIADLYITIQDEDISFNSREARGGGKESLLDPINSVAMDNYELYYSLEIKAAYEDRDVTDEEFQAELLNVQEELRLTVSEMKKNTSKNIKRGTNYSEPSTPLGYNSNSDTIVSNASSVSLGNNWRKAGGRYRKTQKKRKSSRKQTKRKTRRHKK